MTKLGMQELSLRIPLVSPFLSRKKETVQRCTQMKDKRIYSKIYTNKIKRKKKKKKDKGTYFVNWYPKRIATGLLGGNQSK